MKIAFFLFVFGLFVYLFYAGYFSLSVQSGQPIQSEDETSADKVPEEARLESDILNTINRIKNK